jgi:hypothetical protein
MDASLVVIKNPFGAFKINGGLESMLVHVEKAPHIIMACHVMHNFI